MAKNLNEQADELAEIIKKAMGPMIRHDYRGTQWEHIYARSAAFDILNSQNGGQDAVEPDGQGV